MNYRGIAFSAFSLLAAILLPPNVANAAVVFDNVTGVPSDGFSGPTDPGHTTQMGASFSSVEPAFSAIRLLVEAGASTSTGSTSIYLVADTGSTVVNLSGKQLIGTVSDFSLHQGFSLVTFSVGSTVTSPDDKYWVVAASSASSTFEWSYALDAAGFGTTNQDYFNNFNGTAFTQTSDSTGGYQMVVETPEPMTIAVLGSGLAGLGFFRRRAARKA